MSEQDLRTSNELLPCPFCGKEAAVLGSNLIGCIDVVGCGAEVDLGHCTDYGPVVAQWNKRTAVPPVATQWRPIETAPKGKGILVAYRNSLGKWRRVIARYYGPQMLESMDADSEDDYAPEGWYEECESQEDIRVTNELPELWQPLPGAPSTPSADIFEQWRDSTAAKVADEITPVVPPNLSHCSAASDGIHNLYSIESGAWVYEVGCENCKLEIAGRHGPAETKTTSLPEAK